MTSARYGDLPFAEQIEFFRERVDIPTAAWTDVYGAEHDHAFMVAGARGDVLADMRQAVDRAISEGATLADFRRDFDEIVARTGWAYNGGRNWRTRVIYDTNLRQSYNAGREVQMDDPRTRRARPYGLYRHGGSADPRPEHLAWDGLVLPLDDPWWETHSPQNGWGCSCKKFTISERDVQRMGLQVAERAPPVRYEERVVGVRGPSPRVVRVPRGIDPGFEHRPGGSRSMSVLGRIGRQHPPELAAAFAAAASDQARRTVEREYRSWIDRVLEDGVSRGALGTLLVMGPAELDFLTRRGRRPERTDVSIEDRLVVGRKQARHRDAGDALTDEEWRSLGGRLWAPQATLYDDQTGDVLYVIPALTDGRRIKVVVRPDFWDSRKKSTLTSARSVFKVGAQALGDRRRYIVIRGGLEE